MDPIDAESDTRSYINLVSIKGLVFILFCYITALNTICNLTSLSACDNDTYIGANHAKLVNNRDYHNCPQVNICKVLRKKTTLACRV